MLKVIEGGTPPKIKTKYSSSADLCARTDIVIGAGETKIIPLGVKIDLEELKTEYLESYHEEYPVEEQDENKIPEIFDKYMMDSFLKSHFLELKIRSSLSLKGLIVANGVGEIDLDYPDEIGLVVHFPFKYASNLDIVNEYKVKAGERVAQIKLMEHKNYLMPDRFRNEDIRTGGFGSTN